MELFDYEKQHLETLRQSLAECTVLLKSNGDFPLEAPCSIAAYGSGVRRTIKGGTGSGEESGWMPMSRPMGRPRRLSMPESRPKPRPIRPM